MPTPIGRAFTGVTVPQAPRLTRRQVLAAGAGLALGPRGVGAAQPRRYRVLLNSNISGPQAFFFVAQDKGYLRDAGLDAEFVGGDGAAAIVPRIGVEGFDFGYGDLNALVPLVARGVAAAPIAVYVTFNTTPLTIAVDASGPVKSAKDLEGRIIAGHPIDAALEVFPAFALAAGIDPSRVTVQRSPASMRALVEDMLGGKSAGVFGFVNTIIASVAPAGIDGRTRLRFLEYRHHTPDLYGNALMVSRRLLAERPDDVRAFVRAVNRGLADTVRDPDRAIESVAARDRQVRKDVDGPRLMGTLAMEMAHAEGARLGIGDVDDGRLSRGIALIARSRALARIPAPDEIFTRACLPPKDERVTTLAR
jgi:NitT/TauT family transport system substrate-binding protein